MQSISLDLGDIHGAEDGYLSDEEFPPLAGELPPLSPTRNNTDSFGDDDNPLVNGGGSDADKENQGDKKRPRRLVNRKPQPKLDATRLCSDRGLPTLSKHFEQVKFKGKGHEVGDLNRLMSTMEHWAHRLFPKMPFDEVIERIEKLGKKKEVQTCIKKIRLDMPLLDDEFVEQADDPESNVINDDDSGEDGEMDAFSQLAGTSSHTSGTAPDTSTSLSEEQQDRIERNKRLAMERRKSKGLTAPADPRGAITADDMLDLEKNHDDEEDIEHELWNDIAMFEASQRNIWKTSPEKTAQKCRTVTDSGRRSVDVDLKNAPSNAKGTTQMAVCDENSREEVIDIDADVSEERGQSGRGKKDAVADTIEVDSENEGEQIDIDADISEDMNKLEGEKRDMAEETIEVDLDDEGQQIDKIQEDSREVATCIDAEASGGEMKDAAVETIDVDSENEAENIKGIGGEDRVGNMSSDLVLKWDSESADESMTVQEPREKTETADGVDGTECQSFGFSSEVLDIELPLGEVQDVVKDSPDGKSENIEGGQENANIDTGSVEMETN